MVQTKRKAAGRRARNNLIHPRAIVHKGAQLGAGVAIGPYSIVGQHVKVGSNTKIGAHCVLDGRTTIGSGCEIFTGAVIGSIPQDLKYKGEDSELLIGDRNKIREYVTMNPGTKGGGRKTVIGSDCLFMAYAHVAHDCFIGDQVVLANSVALAGHIIIEDHAIVGGLVGVHQFVRIGALSIIGGCSRVIQDVPPYTTCVGVPAKVFGVNSEGLRRVGVSNKTKNHLHRAFRTLFHSRLAFSHALKQIGQGSDIPPEIEHLIAFVKESKRGVCHA